MFRRSAIIAVAAAAVLTLAGCAQAGSSTDSPAPHSSTPTAAATPTPSAQGFSGTYAVTRTLLSTPTPQITPVGTVVTATWAAKPNCASGPCDVTVTSSSGRTFDFAVNGADWIATTQATSQCYTQTSGAWAPNGQTIPETDATDLHVTTASAGVDSELDGKQATSTTTNCSGATAPSVGGVYSFKLVRTGS